MWFHERSRARIETLHHTRGCPARESNECSYTRLKIKRMLYKLVQFNLFSFVLISALQIYLLASALQHDDQ